jgi:CheY-like chemotaxis protein
MCNKILIIDDNEDTLNVISTSLKRLGYEIFKSKSAREALNIWKINDIGIVLTDLSLGGDINGIDLCSRILSRNKQTIMIAMTGYSKEYSLDFCLSIGFRDFLLKPILLEDLKVTIDCASKQRQRFKKMRS